MTSELLCSVFQAESDRIGLKMDSSYSPPNTLNFLQVLPWEIVRMVMDALVNAVGASSASRYRLVSSKFQSARVPSVQLLTTSLEFFAVEVTEAICRVGSLDVRDILRRTTHPNDVCNKVPKKHVVYRALANTKDSTSLSYWCNQILDGLADRERCSRWQYKILLEKLADGIFFTGCQAAYLYGSWYYISACLDEDRLNAAALLGVPSKFDTIISNAASTPQFGRQPCSSFEFSRQHDVPREALLALAAFGGHFSLVNGILDVTQEHEWSALEITRVMEYAISGGNHDTTDCLLRRLLRCSKQVRGCFPHELCSTALRNRQPSIFHLICRFYSDEHPRIIRHPSIIYAAALGGYRDIVEECLEVLLDILSECSFSAGWARGNPVTAAATKGHAEVVQILLSRYPAWANTVNGTEEYHQGHNSTHPLHRASKRGYIRTAYVLLSAGTNPPEYSPLVVASMYESTQIVDYLLKAYPHRYRRHAESALVNACYFGSEIMVRRFASFGVDLDFHYKLPMRLAVYLGNSVIVNTLLDCGAQPVSNVDDLSDPPINMYRPSSMFLHADMDW